MPTVRRGTPLRPSAASIRDWSLVEQVQVRPEGVSPIPALAGRFAQKSGLHKTLGYAICSGESHVQPSSKCRYVDHRLVEQDVERSQQCASSPTAGGQQATVL